MFNGAAIVKPIRVATEIVKAQGHPNISGLHRSTIEITRDNYLTERGDCIVGINADKGLADFREEFKDIMKNNNSILIAYFIINDRVYDRIVGFGSDNLTYSSRRKIIFRRSSFIDESTIVINANKAAKELDRKLISALKKRDTVLTIYLVALEFPEIQSINIGSRSIIYYFPFIKGLP